MRAADLGDELSSVVVTREQIAERITQIAAEIDRDY